MSYNYYIERARNRKMRRQIRYIIGIGITIIILISMLIIVNVVAKQGVGPTQDIISPTLTFSTDTYYFD